MMIAVVWDQFKENDNLELIIKPIPPVTKTMDNKIGYQRNGNTGGYLPYIGDWSSESAIWQTVDSSTRDRFSMMLQSECTL